MNNPKLFSFAKAGDLEHGKTDITLRDLFAGMALAGISSRFKGDPADVVSRAVGISEDAYIIAECMLAERAKETS